MWRAMTVLLLVALACCEESRPAPASPATARRVVSLSPAITSSMIDAGWGDRLVGRTPWCAAAPTVPIVGSLMEVDLERLAATQPDLILIQRIAAGPPPGLLEAASRHGWPVQDIGCLSLDDVRMLTGRIATALREPVPAGAAERWKEILAPIPTIDAGGPVVLLFSEEPPQAFGKDTFLAQAWAAWGGRTLPDGHGHPQVTLEDLFAMHPGRVIRVGGGVEPGPVGRACVERGVPFEVVSDARLLLPGPELREGLRQWRGSLEGARP
jgi:ABC-type hemin transport system substrate-binding protein